MSTHTISPQSEILEKFRITADAEKPNRIIGKDNLEFFVSDQWDTGIRNSRSDANQPCLTINKVAPNVRQVTNAFKKNMPSLNVIATSDDRVDSADVVNGLIRHIQEVSHSDIVYGIAQLSQCVVGWGFFRVISRYVSDNSFDQEIIIEAIPNTLSVYIDPGAVQPDRSDMTFAFIVSDLPRMTFKREYPKAKFDGADSTLSSVGSEVAKEWATEDTIRIAEYFRVVESGKKTIYELQDGSVVDILPDGIEAVKTRQVPIKKVIWQKITAFEVLEEAELPGQHIPIIIVPGEEIYVDGKRRLKGMVEDQKDSQRMYNYWTSAFTEAVALAPKAPFIMAEGQQEGYESQWQSANVKNYAFLTYKPITVEGTLAPPPQRNTAEPPIAAMVSAIQMASEDLKAVTGIYDASLGARSNEVSGKAINARVMQGDIANYHFIDNFANISMPYLGVILKEWIPVYYDGARILRILGEDGTSSYKKINQPSGEMDQDGNEKTYDLTNMDYDFVVDTGPSYKTKRQQDADAITQLLQGNPDLWATTGDLFVKSLDFPDAKLIAERLKKMLPPQLQDDPGKQPIPPQVQQQMQQSSQMIEQLTAQLYELTNERDSKVLELESKERIAFSQMENKIVIEAMKGEMVSNHQLMIHELKSINDRLTLVNQHEPIEEEEAQQDPSQGQLMPQEQPVVL